MNLSTPALEDERLAAWILSGFREPLLRDRVRWVRKCTSATMALKRLSGFDAAIARARERSFSRANEAGFRFVSLLEPDYPALLAETTDPPVALMVWGELRREDDLALSIVGSRRATSYGLDIGRRLARDLAATGLTIVSGLARGIDAAAHRGALEAPGRTLAVLGSGLSNIYPREHRRLAEEVAARGAVVTEFDLDEPPRAENFPRRNRIITGLSLGTLVVEAAPKSGSLVSARHALEQNREVFAVPGPVRSPNSAGVHGLIRDGARLVTEAADVLDELRPDTRERLSSRRARRADPGEAVPSDTDERAILTILRDSYDALDVDSLLDAVEMPTERVLAALGRLEVRGVIVRHPGGNYHVRT